MSIQSEIARLNTAKENIKTAINSKGGSLTNESISLYADAINSLSSGGGNKSLIVSENEVFSLSGTVNAPNTVLSFVPKYSGEIKISGSLQNSGSSSTGYIYLNDTKVVSKSGSGTSSFNETLEVTAGVSYEIRLENSKGLTSTKTESLTVYTSVMTDEAPFE